MQYSQVHKDKRLPARTIISGNLRTPELLREAIGGSGVKFIGPNTGYAPDDVLTELDEVFYPEFDYLGSPTMINAEDEVFFKQKSLNRGAYKTEEFLPATKWETHAEEEEVKVSVIRLANAKTHTVVNYKKALKIPVEFWEDDQHDVVDRAIESMARKARITKDATALRKYADGFSAETTSDGAAVFSNSHTAIGGDTIDNLETGVFNASNLEVLVRSLRKQKDQAGDPGLQDIKGLLVALNLIEDSIEVTDSELKAHVTDNTLNVFRSNKYPSIEKLGTSIHLHSDFMPDLANVNTSYYAVSRNHSLSRWVRLQMATNLVDYKFDDFDRYTYKGRYREITSWIGWEGAAASSGTV